MESSIAGLDVLELLGDDEVVVVDCRSRDEWGFLPQKIPGALRMGLEEILDSPHALPDDELIVLCDGTDGARARRAWRALLLAGRTAVCLRGGLREWIRRGYPTEQITLKPAPVLAEHRVDNSQQNHG
ncbi:MAG: rhodanese-like domain-containing protein [Myxococcaceae bacterium]